MDASGIVIDSTADPELFGCIRLIGKGVFSLLEWNSAIKYLTAVTKSRVMGRPIRFSFRVGETTRVGIARWKDDRCIIHSMPCMRDGHRERILLMMTG